MRGKGVLLVSEVIFLLVSLVLLINGSESRHDVRRRSHQHLSVCRKEFLRPLDKRIADVDLVFTGIVERIYQQFESSSSSESTSGDDPVGSGGGERRRRQHQVAAHHRRHHRHHHHRSHRQHDAVRSFSPGSGSSDWIPGSAEGSAAGSGNSVSVHYRGIVRVKRIIKGDKRFQGKRLIVEGFGSDKFCVSDAKERDTRIFFTNPILNGRLRIHYSLMHVNLENLKKVFLAMTKAAAAAEMNRNETSSWTSSPTDATTRTTTTSTSTTTTTSAPVPQSSSPSPVSDMRTDAKAVALNEIESADRNEERGRKKLRRKKKKSKGKNRKNRRKHLHHVSSSSASSSSSLASSSSSFSSSTTTTTTTTEVPIDASSSTLSIIESLMET